jgi:hypothetical protein
MKKRLIVIASILAVSISANAQLFTYTFSDVTTSSGTTSAGGTASNLIFSSFSAIGTPANPNASNRFSFIDWATGATDGLDTFTGSVDTGEYYEFTITPTNGVAIDLSSIAFTIQRSPTGIRQYSVRSSLDNYAANLSASISPSNANLSVVSGDIFQIVDTITSAQNGSTVTLGLEFDSIASAVSFRFYGFNAEASSGTFSIDNVAVFGALTAVPEPHEYAFAIAALLGFLVLVRRKAVSGCLIHN